MPSPVTTELQPLQPIPQQQMLTQQQFSCMAQGKHETKRKRAVAFNDQTQVGDCAHRSWQQQQQQEDNDDLASSSSTWYSGNDIATFRGNARQALLSHADKQQPQQQLQHDEDTTLRGLERYDMDRLQQKMLYMKLIVKLQLQNPPDHLATLAHTLSTRSREMGVMQGFQDQLEVVHEKQQQQHQARKRVLEPSEAGTPISPSCHDSAGVKNDGISTTWSRRVRSRCA